MNREQRHYPSFRYDEMNKLFEVVQDVDDSMEKAMCQGCRNEGGIMDFLGWPEPCQAYQCIEKKGYNFCCECDDFTYDHLHPYADRANEVPHNAKVFNLCLIKKMGLEKWTEEKAGEVKTSYFKGKFKL